MKAYVCDHCGMFEQVNKLDAGKGPAGRPDGWVTIRLTFKGETEAETHDLCTDCLTELRNFLGKAKP